MAEVAKQPSDSRSGSTKAFPKMPRHQNLFCRWIPALVVPRGCDRGRLLAFNVPDPNRRLRATKIHLVSQAVREAPAPREPIEVRFHIGRLARSN